MRRCAAGPRPVMNPPWGREWKGREGKGSEGKGREGKGKEAVIPLVKGLAGRITCAHRATNDGEAEAKLWRGISFEIHLPTARNRN